MGRKQFGAPTQEEALKPMMNWRCHANGCPLPGGASPEFGPDARYYCRFHYGKHPSQNDQVTYKIRSLRPIFEALEALRVSGDAQAWERFCEARSEDFLRFRKYPNSWGKDVNERDNHGKLISRVSGELQKLIGGEDKKRQPMMAAHEFIDELS